jgi:hypothetical protein
MVRFREAEPVVFAIAAGCDPFRIFAHRYFLGDAGDADSLASIGE